VSTQCPAATASTLSDIEWRPLREGDVPVIAEIESLSHFAPWSVTNFSDALAAGYAMLVAQRGSRMLAYAVLMLAPGEATLLNLTVSPEARRQGIGRALLRRVLADAKRSGATQCFLEVRLSNTRAVQLYLAEGFAPVARRPAYYPASAGREDALVMRAVL
jgi:ribosomal-protein-alanine N-acetyltransferase